MSAPAPPSRTDGTEVLLMTESLNGPRSTRSEVRPAGQVAVIGFVCVHDDVATVGQLRSVSTTWPPLPGSREILLPWSMPVEANRTPPSIETLTSEVDSPKLRVVQSRVPAGGAVEGTVML